jgi:serine/threonine protein kinase
MRSAAPEILLEKDFDEKVDVYSFGIVMWEMVTRLEPYEGRFHNFDELIDGGTLLLSQRLSDANVVQWELRSSVLVCRRRYHNR